MWKSELATGPRVGKVAERSGTAGQARPRYELLTPTSRRLPGDFRARPMLETETHTQMMSLEDCYKDCAVSGGRADINYVRWTSGELNDLFEQWIGK